MDWYGTCYTYYMRSLPSFLHGHGQAPLWFMKIMYTVRQLLKVYGNLCMMSSVLWNSNMWKYWGHLWSKVIYSWDFFNYSVQFKVMHSSIIIFFHIMLNNHTNIYWPLNEAYQSLHQRTYSLKTIFSKGHYKQEW
jgi:hypothetical protein